MKKMLYPTTGFENCIGEPKKVFQEKSIDLNTECKQEDIPRTVKGEEDKMTSQIKPLEILVIEDRGDLVSDVSELMRKTEKCSEIPIKITHREEYAPDIAEIAGSHDVIVTDIGLPGKRLSYELPEEEYENFMGKYEKIARRFEEMYGKDWRNIQDRDHIGLGIFRDSDWVIELINRIEKNFDSPRENWFLQDNISGLQIAKEIEAQGRKVTMYTRDLNHQAGIQFGLFKGIISPEEFLEIYRKQKTCKEREGKKHLLNISGELISVNDGRIILGRKTAENYAKAIKIASDYQLKK